MFHRPLRRSQLISQFDDGETDHTWVQPHSAFDFVLNSHGGIELHDEVVSRVILCLMFGSWPGEVKLTPIRDATDDAFVAENVLACVATDAGRG